MLKKKSRSIHTDNKLYLKLTLGNWRVTRVHVGGKSGDSAHNSVVTASDDDTSSGSFDAVGGEESDVSGFEDFDGGLLGVSGLWLGFTGERGVVDLHGGRGDDSEIGGDSITTLDFDNVAEDEFSSGDVLLFTVSEDKRLLGDHVLEGFHNRVGFRFLVVLEDTSDDDDGGKDDTEVEVVFDWVLGVDALDGVSEEAED